MKTQAWGWLAAAVMAAGLNASYHDGGMRWAHEIVANVQHNSLAVLDLATGRADKFLAEAQVLTAKTERPSACPLSAALAQVQSKFDSQFESRFESQFENQFENQFATKSGEFEGMSAREQAALARLEANRARMEVRLANFRIPTMSAVVVSAPQVSCPRVRVNIQRLPMIHVPATPMVHIETPGAGPV